MVQAWGALGWPWRQGVYLEVEVVLGRLPLVLEQLHSGFTADTAQCQPGAKRLSAGRISLAELRAWPATACLLRPADRILYRSALHKALPGSRTLDRATAHLPRSQVVRNKKLLPVSTLKFCGNTQLAAEAWQGWIGARDDQPAAAAGPQDRLQGAISAPAHAQSAPAHISQVSKQQQQQ